ncbi:unnamed protein product [Cunninghamella echinulata]
MPIFLNSETASSIGYVAHCGFDHPKNIDEALESLNISLINRTHQDKHTPRGLNTFSEDDHRDFEYIHPIIRITPIDFTDNWVMSMKLVHLICAQDRTIDIIHEWREREKKLNKSSRTKFLWEPIPWECLSENYSNIKKAGQYVDIISPNHEEVISFLGLTTHTTNDDNEDINKHIKNPTISEKDPISTKKLIEQCGRQLKKDFPHAVIVIRCGKLGACVIDATTTMEEMKWVPPYWTAKTEEEKRRIVDPTGCGNAFCGGFLVGYHESNGDPVISAMYGSVASSFVLEQVGVPQLHHSSSTDTINNNDHDESWNNGPSPRERLKQLQLRCL